MIKELLPGIKLMWEQGNIQESLANIDRITQPDRYDTTYWLVNRVKERLLYSLGCLLPHQMNAQATVDEVFADQLPGTFHWVRKNEKDFSVRWRQATIIGGQLNDLLVELGINGVIDWRAKSLYSIYKKTRRFPIGLDEIFDRIGLRVVVQTDLDVEKIANSILTRPLDYRLMQEQRFRRLDKVHRPIRIVEREDGYKALHMNLFARNVESQEVLFELQLMTMENFARLYPGTVPQVRKMYKLRR